MKIWVWELWEALIEEPSIKADFDKVRRLEEGEGAKARIYEEWKSSVVSNNKKKKRASAGPVKRK